MRPLPGRWPRVKGRREQALWCVSLVPPVLGVVEDTQLPFNAQRRSISLWRCKGPAVRGWHVCRVGGVGDKPRKSRKYKKYKHPISTIPSKIRAGICVTIQPWGIRNLTVFRRYPHCAPFHRPNHSYLSHQVCQLPAVSFAASMTVP